MIKLHGTDRATGGIEFDDEFQMDISKRKMKTRKELERDMAKLMLQNLWLRRVFEYVLRKLFSQCKNTLL
jgi:hypothetical protein